MVELGVDALRVILRRDVDGLKSQADVPAKYSDTALAELFPLQSSPIHFIKNIDIIESIMMQRSIRCMDRNCDLEFPNKNERSKHIRRVHQQVLTSHYNDGVEVALHRIKGVFKCPVCPISNEDATRHSSKPKVLAGIHPDIVTFEPASKKIRTEEPEEPDIEPEAPIRVQIPTVSISDTIRPATSQAAEEYLKKIGKRLAPNPLWLESVASAWSRKDVARLAPLTELSCSSDPPEFEAIKEICLAIVRLLLPNNEGEFDLSIHERGATTAAYIMELVGTGYDASEFKLKVFDLILYTMFDHVFLVEDYDRNYLLKFLNVLAVAAGRGLVGMTGTLDQMVQISRYMMLWLTHNEYYMVSTSRLPPEDSKYTPYNIGLTAAVCERYELLSSDLPTAFAAMVRSVDAVCDWEPPASHSIRHTQDLIVIDRHDVLPNEISNAFVRLMSNLQATTDQLVLRQSIEIELGDVHDQLTSSAPGDSFAQSFSDNWLLRKAQLDPASSKTPDGYKIRPEFLQSYSTLFARTCELMATALMFCLGEAITPQEMAHLCNINGRFNARNLYISGGDMFVAWGKELRVKRLPRELATILAKILVITMPFWEHMCRTSQGPANPALSWWQQLDPPSLFYTYNWRPYSAVSISNILRTELQSSLGFDMKPEVFRELSRAIKGTLGVPTIPEPQDTLGSPDLFTVAFQTIASFSDARLRQPAGDDQPWYDFLSGAMDQHSRKDHRRLKIPLVDAHQADSYAQMAASEMAKLNEQADINSKVLILTRTTAQAQILSKSQSKPFHSDTNPSVIDQWKIHPANHILVTTLGVPTDQFKGINIGTIVHVGNSWSLDEVAEYCLMAQRLVVYTGAPDKRDIAIAGGVGGWLHQKCLKSIIQTRLKLPIVDCKQNSEKCSNCRNKIGGTATRDLLDSLANLGDHCPYCLLHIDIPRPHQLAKCKAYQSNGPAQTLLAMCQDKLPRFQHICSCGFPTDFILTDRGIWDNLTSAANLPLTADTDWLLGGGKLENGVRKVITALVDHGFFSHKF
ncbi:hypothetical protein TWF281_004631 [Arthrobotrys megalospora]